jgi:hypothetical protein
MVAMTLYEMPAKSAYQRPFRIFAWVAVVVLFVILCIAIWTPAGLSDETRKVLAWIAGAIVVAAVVVGNRLGFKQGLWKLKEGYRVEISDGKIIQSRPGSPVIKIPADQIASLSLFQRSRPPCAAMAFASSSFICGSAKQLLSKAVSIQLESRRSLSIPNANQVRCETAKDEVLRERLS